MIALILNSWFSIRLIDVIDILLVAVLLYQTYRLIKGTVAINIFLGIASIYLIWKLVKLLEMELLSEILGQFISVGVIALIVVFQPEIRQFLLLLGTPSFMKKKRRGYLFSKLNLYTQLKLDINPIVQACQKMSASQTGALIVLARRNELFQFVNTGEPIDATVSQQLIENIFYKNSPLHDGAMIILYNRIKAARCILPVSGNTNLPAELGLRHRSALGITEVSDAIAIIVSEQSGKISFCKGTEIQIDLTPSKLKNILEEEFN
ncbi:MAG: diadenylate cyclase CdaA [Bacteroidota bacterium]